jgi:hypothetical protein
LSVGGTTVFVSAFGLLPGSPIDSIHRGRRMIARGGWGRVASSACTAQVNATVAATENSDRETERGRHRSVATKESSLVANSKRPKAAGG